MKKCVRCGSILSGTDASVDVYPPRAGRFEKSLQLAGILRLSLTVFHAIYAFSRKLRLETGDRMQNVRRIEPLAIRAVIPGWPQRHMGLPVHARGFFFVWLVCLVLSFLLFGTFPGQIALGVMIGAHLSSILNVVISVYSERRDRIKLAVVMLVLATLIYIPGTIAWRHWIVLQQVAISAGPLQTGDVMIILRREGMKPNVGNIIVFTQQERRFQNYVLRGDTIDRVLAVEGQHVKWKSGILEIDGKPSFFEPIVSGRTPPDCEFTVPERCCYVVPSIVIAQLRMPPNAVTWREMGIVRYEQIHGEVWAIRRSVFRFVRLHG